MLKKYLFLFWKFFVQHLKTMMEYRADFALALLGFAISQAAGIIFIYLIFQRIPHLNGWNFYEIVFIYGFAQLPRGVDHFITDNLWDFSWATIAKGEFDRHLLRPINPLFQIIAERFQPEALGELIVGTILVVMSLMHLEIAFSILNVFCFVIVLFAGAIIYTSIKLFFASLAFWIIRSFPIMAMTYQISEFAKYPIGIYSKTIRMIITFIIPFAYTAFIPAGYFVGKIGMQSAVLGTVTAAVISFGVAYTTWLRGISVYQSAGN